MSVVENVIEDLEKANKELIGTDNDVVNGIDIGCIIDNAIKTIEELQSKSEELCEWRIVDRPNGLPIYNTSCGAIRLSHITGVDIYCNACGKKLKVVE